MEGEGGCCLNKDDYVKIVGVDNNYRYGYISEIKDSGLTFVISMFEEGESKVQYDAAQAHLFGEPSIDYISPLTNIEKRFISLITTGYTIREMAVLREVTPITVRSQLRTLWLKLQLENRDQLYALAPALDSMLKKQSGVDKEIENWKNHRST